jgi:hypothetical protein
MCYAQEATDSCGIACAIMANFKLKSGSLGTGDFAKTLFPSYGAQIGKLLGSSSGGPTTTAEQQVYKLVSSTYDGTAGTTGSQVAALLNALSIGTWTATDPAPSNKIAGQVVASFKAGWPIIIGNSWYKGPTHLQKAKGGHWVLVDAVNTFGGQLYASVCDPITGNVHVTPFTVGQDFVYDPSNPIGIEVPVDNSRPMAKDTSPRAIPRWMAWFSARPPTLP